MMKKLVDLVMSKNIALTATSSNLLILVSIQSSFNLAYKPN
jgi:hypothetical protein